jgi:phenylalanyl-tRNA synthetase beta chain
MQLNEKWLREWIDVPLSIGEIAESLTLAGLEVDTVTPAGPCVEGLLVVEILGVKPHPDSDHLSVCSVFDGTDTHQVVCGAPNVADGLKTAFARVGCVLPGNKGISVTTIRGIESFGMLCSWSEIGLGEGSDGIVAFAQKAEVGAEVSDYLDLDDTILDIDITPNRGDCLSVLGIARDLSAISGTALNPWVVDNIPAENEFSFPVTILDEKGCSSYASRVIRDVDLSRATPDWMQERLRRCGVRCINPIVDVVNYVMIELGQPMHAFDHDLLSTGIDVRSSVEGEKIVILDGQELELESGSLVIADGNGPVALAGIIGGFDSAVTSRTINVFLESAWFEPIALATMARHYRLSTDASKRYERGVDPLQQARAIERATKLILDICGGTSGPTNSVISGKSRFTCPRIEFSPMSVNKLLGTSLDNETICRTLENLEMVVDTSDDCWIVTPPSYRSDVVLGADLVEEVARIVGYDKIPMALPTGQAAPQALSAATILERQARQVLLGRGFSEVITYSFISNERAVQFSPEAEKLVLMNPISVEMDTMRPSLLSGLIDTAVYNLNRQKSSVQVFEIGLVFDVRFGDVAQRRMLGGLCSGMITEGWSGSSREFDYYGLKKDVEVLLDALGEKKRNFSPMEVHGFHKYQTGVIVGGGRKLGLVAALDPTLLKALGIAKPTFYFELYLDELKEGAQSPYQPISKYPTVKRDLNLVINENIESSTLLDSIRSSGGEQLLELELLDVYRGQGIDSGKKSVTLSLIFQSNSRTLTYHEIDKACDMVLAKVKTDLGGVLRE